MLGDRNRILTKLSQVWNIEPNWRLGQLMSNIGCLAADENTPRTAECQHPCNFHVRDADFESALDTYLLSNSSHTQRETIAKQEPAAYKLKNGNVVMLNESPEDDGTIFYSKNHAWFIGTSYDTPTTKVWINEEAVETVWWG